jgi:hypothetical protein
VGDAKNIIVKPISSQDANKIIKALHYSGKVVNNSQLHLGVFLDGRCGGAMQFGPSLDKRKIVGLVQGTLWNEFLELNRLAFADWLPRNGESRAIAYAMRFIKKTYPWMKWIISFADGTQCGDGTIYRASGFVLTAIKSSEKDLWELPPDLAYLSQGEPTVHRITIQCKTSAISHWCVQKYKTHNVPLDRLAAENGGTLHSGFQLRYIYFLDPTAKDRLTVPILPFSEIERRGAGMYKGIKRDKQAIGGDHPHSDECVTSIDSDAPGDQLGERGASPTVTLQNINKVTKEG